MIRVKKEQEGASRVGRGREREGQGGSRGKEGDIADF